MLARRRWFADDDADAEDDDQSGTDEDNGESETDETSSGDDDAAQTVEDLPDWAQKIIRDVRSEAAENRKKLREIEKAAEDAERKKAEEQGEFQKLWEEAQPKLSRLEELEAADQTRREQLVERNEKRIKELSADAQKTVKAVIEKLGDDPYKIADVLDELIPTLTQKPPAPGLDGGAKGDGKGSMSGKVTLKRTSY